MLENKTFFFVIGTPKSGTTWLQRLLDAHPQVSCFNEGHFYQFGRGLAQAADTYNRIHAERSARIFGGSDFPPITQEEYSALMRCFITGRLERAGGKPGAHLVGEKNPENGMHLAGLTLAFPDAKYVHIIRDGRDVAVSGWHHNKRYDEKLLHEKYPGGFAEYAVSNIKSWAGLIRGIRDTAAAKDVAYHELRYEDLAADPAATLAELFGFLGADIAAVADCVARASFESLSGGRKPGEEDSGSFFRKGVAGDWRNHMDETLRRRVAEASGGMLALLGYDG